MIGAITAGLFGVGVPPVTNSYESIATVTVGSGGSGSISFASIPSSFKHLQLRMIGRTNRSGENQDPFKMRFNSDSASNYGGHFLVGDGSSASAFADLPASFVASYTASATTATASVFGVSIVDILDYTNTNKNKTLRSLGGFDSNGAGSISLVSGLWRSTAAINEITITPQIGTVFNQYSQIALYGIKG